MDTIVGFVHINKEATTCHGADNPKEFIGQTCAVMEFASDGGALVLNPQGSALAMFDKEDIQRSFKCGVTNNVITPPNLGVIAQSAYATKAMMRKGGYDNLVMNMVIQASLSRGEFCDSFLWQNQ